MIVLNGPFVHVSNLNIWCSNLFNRNYREIGYFTQGGPIHSKLMFDYKYSKASKT